VAEKAKLDDVTRKTVMKRVRGQEYIDNVLGPAADGLIDAIADGYERLGSCFGEYELYRAQGHLQGLQEALSLIRHIARQSRHEEQD
jgi:hypothetical protein